MRRAKWMATGMFAATLFAGFGPCTTTDLQGQLANGFRTSLNGLLNIGTTAFVNSLFGVDN